jgi:hypothetical protein
MGDEMYNGNNSGGLKKMIPRKNRVKKILFCGWSGLVLATFITACSSAKFSGASEISNTQSNQTVILPDPSSARCGDKVNIRWEGKAKECIVGQGRPFDFRTGECSVMKAPSYECTWQNLSNELVNQGFPAESQFQTSQKEGGRLIACGVSPDGLITIFQWFNPPASQGQDCSLDQSQIQVKTECFEIDLGPDPIQIPANEAERDQKVYECLQKARA